MIYPRLTIETTKPEPTIIQMKIPRQTVPGAPVVAQLDATLDDSTESPYDYAWRIDHARELEPRHDPTVTVRKLVDSTTEPATGATTPQKLTTVSLKVIDILGQVGETEIDATYYPATCPQNKNMTPSNKPSGSSSALLQDERPALSNGPSVLLQDERPAVSNSPSVVLQDERIASSNTYQSDPLNRVLPSRPWTTTTIILHCPHHCCRGRGRRRHRRVCHSGEYGEPDWTARPSRTHRTHRTPRTSRRHRTHRTPRIPRRHRTHRTPRRHRTHRTPRTGRTARRHWTRWTPRTPRAFRHIVWGTVTQDLRRGGVERATGIEPA